MTRTVRLPASDSRRSILVTYVDGARSSVRFVNLPINRTYVRSEVN